MEVPHKRLSHTEDDFDSSLKTSLNEETDRLVYVSDDVGSGAEERSSHTGPTKRSQQFADFSNVFKAFIGASLIGLPFAIKNAGIALGVIGMIVIAVLTDHCCHLIVKCKRYAIEKVCNEMETNGADEYAIFKRRQYLGVKMSYGQIGKASLGRLGSLLVNISIMITQYGFCVGYFIFFGNTLRSVIFTLMHVKTAHMSNITSNATLLTTVLPPTTGTPVITTTPQVTTLLPSISTSNHSINFTTPIPSNSTNFTQPSDAVMVRIFNSTLLPMIVRFSNNTNSTGIFHVLKKVLKQPLSHDNLQRNNEWTFTLLLTMPLPILILISFVRQIRKLAPISVIANASITAAFVATAIFIIVSFKSPRTSLVYFNFASFPVFFGQITASYEGIGTVIPIEGSMAENRVMYPCYLHISLTLLTAILGSFGILGYVRYGEDVSQIVTENLTGMGISNALRLLLFVGILFTYPLQIYPVIQITESALFGRRGICRSRGGVYSFAGGSQPTVNEAPAVSEVRIAPWKRYITRTFLVLSTAFLAVIFRSQFAYISALTGSIGSALLSYILPCLFHLCLRKGRLSKRIIVKDYLLIIFGMVGGITGVAVTVQHIIANYDKHRKIKV